MYLPRNVPLCRPHVAMWIGESGKRYDFAVCRPGTIRMDEPAVYILARHEGDVTTPLFVGCTGSLHRIGMSHGHLRLDASSRMTRQAEVKDLVAALRPALNDELVRNEERSMPAFEA